MTAPRVGTYRWHVDLLRRTRLFPRQWFSISPVLDEDDRLAGVGVFGPRHGVAVYRHWQAR